MTVHFPGLPRRVAAVLLCAAAISVPFYVPAGPFALAKGNSEAFKKIIAGRKCPCGCGRYLPNGPNEPSCFGCSVGKAEETRILEALAAGIEPIDIIIELNEPVIVDVFADYTDKELPALWKRAQETAGERNQHRVVLRTPGRTDEARLAVRIAECVRATGSFTGFQEQLIAHEGPWDEATLVGLAGRSGVDTDALVRCLPQTTARAQIDKDREHARIYGIESYPAIAVNRVVTPSTEAIRRAIDKILKAGSI